MRKLCKCMIIVLGATLVCCSVEAQTKMTFEEFINNDQAPLSTFYDGITFIGSTTGSEWVARDATSYNYNMSSWDCLNDEDTGQAWNEANYWICDLVGTTTALDSTGDDGIISFENEDATYFELRYTSFSNLYLNAYNSADDLIDGDSGPANLRYVHGNESGPGTLRVEAPAGELISYVVIHDGGNYWVIDNVATDASGIVIPPNASMDIQPAHCPNELDLAERWSIQIAILGADEYDISEVDLSTVRLEGVEPFYISEHYVDWSRPVENPQDCECTEEGRDGLDDIFVKFNTPDILAVIGNVVSGEEYVLEMTGEFLNGTSFVAYDCITFINPPMKMDNTQIPGYMPGDEAGTGLSQ